MDALQAKFAAAMAELERLDGSDMPEQMQQARARGREGGREGGREREREREKL